MDDVGFEQPCNWLCSPGARRSPTREHIDASPCPAAAPLSYTMVANAYRRRRRADSVRQAATSSYWQPLGAIPAPGTGGVYIA